MFVNYFVRPFGLGRRYYVGVFLQVILTYLVVMSFCNIMIV